jgi:hypothetical protein
MPWSSDVAERLKRRHRAEAVPWIEKRTIVIYALAEGGLPVPQGSGVLLQVADRGFVVTAAHCLDGWGKVRFLCAVDDGGFIDLTTVQAHVTRDRGDADFALLPLDDEMFARVSSSRAFVRLSEVDAHGDAPATGIHALFGYPVQLASRREGCIVSDALYYPTMLKNVSDLDRDLSVAFFMDDEHVDEVGDRTRLPALQGVSGGGMWRLHTKGDDPEAWSVDRIRLVGIEHTVVERSGTIKGVRARHVLAGMAAQFPELAPSVRLVGVFVAAT